MKKLCLPVGLLFVGAGCAAPMPGDTDTDAASESGSETTDEGGTAEGGDGDATGGDGDSASGDGDSAGDGDGTAGDGDGTTGDGDGTTGDGDGCEPGAEGCTCFPNDTCFAPLECVGGTCTNSCPEGSMGCACFPNDTCLGILSCVDGTCESGLPDGASCMENVECQGGFCYGSGFGGPECHSMCSGNFGDCDEDADCCNGTCSNFGRCM